MENKKKLSGRQPLYRNANVVVGAVEALACLTIAVLAGYENVRLSEQSQPIPAGIRLLLWSVLILALLLGATIAQLFSVVNRLDRLTDDEPPSPSVDRQDGSGDAP